MPSRTSPAIAIAAGLLLLIALALGIGGVWLVALGGSWYYLIAALLLGLSGGLMWRRSAASLWVYAVFVIGTLAWSWREAGLDWWPLAARVDVPFLVGVWLLTPWVRRGLGAGNGVAGARGGAAALALSLAAFVVMAVASWTHDLHETSGSFPPTASAAPAPTGAASADRMPAGDWQSYGRTANSQRYSPLAQITPQNVRNLQEVWHFHTGDIRGRPGDPVETTYEVTPLKVGNRLFLCTPHNLVIALDATSGAELWRYDPKLRAGLALQHLTCRGLSYQAVRANAGASRLPASDDTGMATTATAAAAIPPTTAASATATARGLASPASAAGATAMPGDLPIASTATPRVQTTACGAKLFMPTADGRLIALDPETGAVCAGFGHGSGQVNLWAGMPNVQPGAYYSTSPVVVTARLVIVGGTVLDNVSTDEQSGVIRAFDIDTGDLVWNWDSGNPDVTTPLPPGQHYTVNSPNSWSISAADETLGMVYVPMGNQPPDQWGGKRSPAVERYSSSVVALDLATGKVRWVFQTVHHDLWDYDVPAQPNLIDLTIAGQPVPALVQPTKQGELFVLDRRNGRPVLPVTEVPAPQGAATGDRSAPTQPRSALSYDPPVLRERDMWGGTMFDQLACRIAFRQLRYEGRFTPPSEQGSLIYPGNFGVFNWGSIAVDPARQIAVSTPAHLAFVSRLIRRPDASALLVNPNRSPTDPLPALNENVGAPFAVKLSAFTSPLGLPCQEPPWGNIAGADLTTGRTVWMHRNGTVRDASPLPLPFRMGVPNLGGPIVTAGGVAFLSGTLDYYLRAYDVTSGRQLWQSRLPAGAQATPMTYTAADGRQFVLVVAGGHGSTGTKPGDSVIAYAVPGR